jgi:hypothetical protein
MIGGAHLQYHPTFWNEMQAIMMTGTYEGSKGSTMPNKRRLASTKNKSKRSKKSAKLTKAPTGSPDPDCEPAKVELSDYPQWEAEKGYWIGEYTFLQGDGTPFVSPSWNYPYDHYKGFITGEVVG